MGSHFPPFAEILFLLDYQALEIDFFSNIDLMLDDRTDPFDCGTKPYLFVEFHK